MIIDLGSSRLIFKKSNKIIIGGLTLLPICMGCKETILEGSYYFTNDTGAFCSHVKGTCIDEAKRNLLSYYEDY